MNERRVFGDALAHSLGLHDAPTLAARTLRASSIAATRISCGPKQIGMTPQIPPEDSFIVAQYLTRLPYHELWSGGRPLIAQGYAMNAMRIVNLTGAFSARITHPHESLNFHIPRAALDELADDAGRPRLAHLACTPGIVDPVLVHLTAALLPAFERPEQANSLFLDYVVLAVCSYLVDKYGDGAPPAAIRKAGLTTAQLRRAKEILAANSSGHVLLAVQHRMAYQGEYFAERHGFGAAEATPSVAKMLAKGVKISAGTDATRVASYNPWVSLSWLVTGRTVGGLRITPQHNCVDRETALRMWTENVTWFSNEEGKKGRIEVGQLADLIVPDRDFFACGEDDIADTTGLLTMVGGRIVYGVGDFAKMSEAPPPPAMPDWSPAAFWWL
jgi:hypothetical protein